MKYIMKDIRQTIISAFQSVLPNFPDATINKRIHATCHFVTIAEAVNWIVIDSELKSHLPMC